MNMETTTNAYQKQPDKKPSTALVVLVIILGLAVIILGYKYYQESRQLGQTTEEKAILEDVKSDLEKQLRDMIVEYDSLKTNNDSVNNLLVQEQDKIKRLLRMQASDAEKIRKYREELETLRKVMRSYIVQIDSLNTKNRMLAEENIQVRQQLSTVESANVELSKEREILNTQVQLAKVLSAKNIVAEPQNNGGKPNSKVKKVAKIKVCFTVRENSVTEPGTKEIYLRIIRPDEVVLPAGSGETFEFKGEQVVYSASRQLEYENKDIDICIFWDKNADLIAGTYTIILYAEGYEIGSSTFTLK
jgi:Tfp pilus assembly protein PilO